MEFMSPRMRHGSDQEDWFTAEKELLPPLAVERHVTDTALRLTRKCQLCGEGPGSAVGIDGRHLRHPLGFKSVSGQRS